ncbi:MAG: GerAB/ArcD/ProY family transporter [Oscillospiraceae bacterium]|nr:GerAB/ArcD/ProY family transporter [Oscillospiraceae bacterium]
MKDSISTKQMNTLLFVGLLSPVIRLFPAVSVNMGGKAAWLSPIVALPVALMLTALIHRFLKKSAPDEALGDMIIKAVGSIAGRIVLAILALWLMFYTGFIVKSSAERLISSIYPNGQSGIFVITLLAVGVYMATGKLKSLGRMTEIFAAVIGAILLIILVTAAFKIEPSNLLPVTVRDVDNIAVGAIPAANIIGIGAYAAFLKTGNEKAGRYKSVLIMTLIITAITVTTLGILGEELIGSLQHSFFVMLRDIELAGVLERIEAAVIITWVITDLVYVTILLKICGQICDTVLSKENKIKNIIFSAIISLIVAVFVIENAFSMLIISGILIPMINILVVYLLIPLLFVVGRIRQKI